MIRKIITKIFGSRNQRLIKRLRKVADEINALEPSYQSLNDAELQHKTVEFRERLDKGETLEQLLPEAFATVREAGKRVLNMRHFDVQLIGAMVLNQGKISEMRTGEGKTLVATLAAYLNALPSKGVHVVTVNDYLAKRDAEWMGQLYGFLGLSTGIIIADLSHEERKAAYAADITYGTNNEFGFDYLRDNMAFQTSERVQRPPYFAIVDEVDSILIDEARTPLIISGAAENSSDLYQKINVLIPNLNRQERMAEKDEDEFPGDYAIDEKNKQTYLSDEGHEHIEEMLTEAGLLDPDSSLYDAVNISLLHHVNAALRAHVLFERNVDYIVKDDEIVIIDEFTGRSMPGRRWSEGLHQAVEAKEGVKIQNENQTLASITFQNYFRLYKKLSGMTGTADTEAFEFQQIYGLEVIVVPTHRNMVRNDMGDLIYLTPDEKYDAIIEDIEDCLSRKQPVLVGTVSIEISELLSNKLKKLKIKHEVLNAKFHQKEAQIIADAGKLFAVTIATNMAGRGTDIMLGGNLEHELAKLGEDASEETIARCKADWEEQHKAVLEAGGLHIIGTERHESRRIDNQLRGRAGRQGDAGSSRFYLSMQDSLMRIFASERVATMMQKLGMEKGEAIEHPWVTRAIENAQRKVEGRNFDTRKQLLEYDDVANDQRRVIYQQRSELMEAENVDDIIETIREDVVNELIDIYVPPSSPDEIWELEHLEKALKEKYMSDLPLREWMEADHDLHEETLRDKIVAEVTQSYRSKEEQLGTENVRRFEKAAMLQILDQHWKEHLAAMDYLRQSIGLRGYAQKNPKQEYKREAFEMFTELLERIKKATIKTVTLELFRASEQIESDLQALQAKQHQDKNLEFKHASVETLQAMGGEADMPEPQADPEAQAPAEPEQPFVRSGRKVGRNEPCPCGSGKKYKQCHGKLQG